MDPTTAYTELVLAIRRGDGREAREYAVALREWLDKGGFPPVGIPLAEVEMHLAMVLDPYGDKRDGVK